jgi:hypothetical protein
MTVNFDDFWQVGPVRTRAKALDPFAGLRGRAYIEARMLGRNQVERLDAKATAEAKDQSRENLVKAINQRPLDASVKSKIVFASGEKEYIKGPQNRRFSVVKKGGAR